MNSTGEIQYLLSNWTTTNISTDEKDRWIASMGITIILQSDQQEEKEKNLTGGKKDA